jgi:hypothetical protein
MDRIDRIVELTWRRLPKPLPSMREVQEDALARLAARGIWLVVPGFEMPPKPQRPEGDRRVYEIVSVREWSGPVVPDIEEERW